MKKLGYLLFLILITVVLSCFVGCEGFNSNNNVEPDPEEIDYQIDSKTWLQLLDSKNDNYKDCSVSGYAYNPDTEEYYFLKAAIDDTHVSFSQKLLKKEDVKENLNIDDYDLKATIIDTVTDTMYLETNIGLWVKESNNNKYGFDSALDVLRNSQHYYSSFEYNKNMHSYRKTDSYKIYELYFNNKKLVTYRELNILGNIELVRFDFSYGITILTPDEIYNAEDYLEYDNTELGLYVKANDKAKTLTKIALPEFVEILDDSSFLKCNNLKTIKLPKSLKILEKDTIPNTVETIEYDGKKAELASKIITLDKDITITCTDGVFVFEDTIDGITYEIENGGYCVKDIDRDLVVADIKENVNDVPVVGIDLDNKSIYPDVFYKLTRIVIPSKINSISDDSFKYCSKLVEVCNLSKLNIAKESKDNGYVGYYAKEIYTSKDTTKIVTENDYIKYKVGNEVILLGYVGNDSDLVLPNDITSIRGYIASQLDSIEITSDLSADSLDWDSIDGLKTLEELMFNAAFVDGVTSTTVTSYDSTSSVNGMKLDVYFDTLKSVEAYYKSGILIPEYVEDGIVILFVKDDIVIPESILKFKLLDYDCEWQAKGTVTHNGNTYTQYELIIPDLDA